VFPSFNNHSKTEIVFLGSILEPFEVERSKPRKSPATKSPVVFFDAHHHERGRAITATTKPDMTHDVRRFPKISIKSQFQKKSLNQQSDPSSVKLESKPAVPYRHLKLYPQWWSKSILLGQSPFLFQPFQFLYCVRGYSILLSSMVRQRNHPKLNNVHFAHIFFLITNEPVLKIVPAVRAWSAEKKSLNGDPYAKK